MSGAIPPLHSFMAWCSDKARGQLYLYRPLKPKSLRYKYTRITILILFLQNNNLYVNYDDDDKIRDKISGFHGDEDSDGDICVYTPRNTGGYRAYKPRR
jgi:hypothetical protein